jgi:uncharacterized protein YutE (UPF0331/DUF86 family)
MSGIGEKGLGDLARAQLESARADPRLDRARGAMVADFWDSIEETERVRSLFIWGLVELSHSLEREEESLGVSRDDPELSAPAGRSLQSAWERSQLAQIERRNGHPHANAQALISMYSALDALIEDFAPALRALQAKLISRSLFQRAASSSPELESALTDDQREQMLKALESVIDEKLPKLSKLAGSGPSRYENLLKPLGLGEPADRLIPDDLREALTELGALRDVLVHRAGRVDAKALKQAPTLSQEEGQFVRLRDEDYRKYSAAVRCYAAEVFFRSIRGWPEVTDEEDGPRLADWRGYYRLGA